MKTKWFKWVAVLAVVASQKVTATVIVTDVVVVGGQEWARASIESIQTLFITFTG